MTEDSELLRRYAEDGAEAAFAELVRRHLDLVYNVALRKVGGDAHLAEDVAQRVFVDLARKAHTLFRHPVITGWLFTSTHYAASELVRAEHRRRNREEKAEAMNELHRDDAAASMDWERLRPLLDDLIRDLNERDRDAVLLRFFEGQSFAEIGSKLNVSEEGARSRTDRALEKLHLALARRGVTSTASALGMALANHAAAVAPAGLAASVTGTALADAGGATVLGFLSFMSTTKFVASAAAILAVFTVSIGGYQLHAQREAEAALAADRQAYGARLATLRDWEQRLRAGEQTAAQLKKELDDARAERSVTGAATAKPAADYDPVAAGNEYMRLHPEIRQANEDAVRGENRFLYDPVFRSLGLSDAQVDEILKLHEWHYAGTKDGKYFVQASEFTLSKAERESRIRTILGEEGYAQYAAARVAIPGKLLTTKLAIALAFSDTPLTPPQAEQMIQLANANQPERGPLNWEAVIAESAKFLSPEQLATLRWVRAAEKLPSASQQTSAK